MNKHITYKRGRKLYLPRIQITLSFSLTLISSHSKTHFIYMSSRDQLPFRPFYH
ncbi:hypothetical protein HanXRQr2_Chr01g0008831 [Helianthus annuus]|uniref:Uncharacterized protein n=1 Tax=Helianthus annuus TaxID=4232 RepID=A0A9K3P1Y7_HELAN|nr:hypothetical protein HanXRQr2_Chr01g0008831 [Helianthus annuus]KAJ0955925.1 hypothetical protein HanPSC8_Chr01g0008551 [Helianthus annuus]